MDVTLVRLLAFLVLAALWGPVEVDGNYQIWVSNASSQTLIATTTYNNGQGWWVPPSDFVNRTIVPRDHQADQYERFQKGLFLDIWVEGSCCPERVTLDNDESVVAYNSGVDGGVNIFQAVDGTLWSPDLDTLLTTVYPEIDIIAEGAPVNNMCTKLC